MPVRKFPRLSKEDKKVIDEITTVVLVNKAKYPSRIENPVLRDYSTGTYGKRFFPEYGKRSLPATSFSLKKYITKAYKTATKLGKKVKIKRSPLGILPIITAVEEVRKK